MHFQFLFLLLLVFRHNIHSLSKLYVAFFDPKDWGLIAARQDKLKELQKSEKHLTKQITETRAELSLLKTSAQTIERYAREKYLMKKDNEDVFLVNTP